MITGVGAYLILNVGVDIGSHGGGSSPTNEFLGEKSRMFHLQFVVENGVKKETT
jgi:hypothetical protein